MKHIKIILKWTEFTIYASADLYWSLLGTVVWVDQLKHPAPFSFPIFLFTNLFDTLPDLMESNDWFAVIQAKPPTWHGQETYEDDFSSVC